MIPFLAQVAAHYFQAPDIQRHCFVFPNRRSMVFFRKYLGEQVKERGGGVPLPVPPMFTINDFFYAVYKVEVTDGLRLLLELYDCYRALNPAAEPLDEFIYWGEVMLQDFDDIDKYLVHAEDLLRNVSDFKAIQDSFEYLSGNQRAAIEQFLSHFRDGKESEIKTRFVQLWNLLFPLYTQFRARLQEKGMAYEGMVYRSLADALKAGTPAVDLLSPVFPETGQFVFVGLNALTECERLLLSRMRDAGLAQFVWDFVSTEIQDPANKASLFMRKNVTEFPQAFPIDPQGLPRPKITVVSVPSSVGQAKLAGHILQEAAAASDVETAFVLPDETLLLPLLNSIPPQHDNVNVTMGYPMRGSSVYTLLQALGQMQLRLRHRPDGWYFYYRTVREVFASGLFRALLSEEEMACVARVKADAKYFIPLEDLQGGPVLDLFFQAVITEPTLASARQNHAMERYFSDVVALVGRQLSASGDMLLELDFAKRCHTQLNILQDTDLELLPATHLRLLEASLEGISVPFRGEPLQGLQVMGPLETRALDFRNLVILSANEGMFPRKSFSASFIPPELRKGFGLPTYEYQDAVWAYYFYRMIQRAEHVWLLYDSRTEGLKSGEESRYIKQLEYHFHMPLERLAASAEMHPVAVEETIPKTEAHVETIRNGVLSASALQSYLYCPARFYYQFVEHLQAEDEVAESLDAGMLGNVFHRVMQQLYSRELVTRDYLEAAKKDSARLRRLIRAAVLEEMHSVEVSGRNLVLEEVLLDYVRAALKHDIGLLAASASPGFRILGLELRRETTFEGFRIKGYIDRMDSYRPGEVRIVDYKTGKVEDDDLLITDDNAAAVVEKLFGESNNGRPKIALQLFVYGLFAHADATLKGERVLNSIYSTGRLYTGALPDVPESPEFIRLVREKLRDMLSEMVDVNVPFRRTRDAKTCAICDFKNICGR